MAGIKDVGIVRDEYSGREVRVALSSEKYLCCYFLVWVRKKNCPWVKQKGVSVPNSDIARDWVMQELLKGKFL